MPLKFAVVREDPTIEIEAARRVSATNALVVASGGCTAFALHHALPDLALTLYDFNPDQHAHVFARAAAIRRGDSATLNIDDASPSGLSQNGAFESLFRVLATAIRELVVPEDTLEGWFAAGTHPSSAEQARAWFDSPYWPSAFHVAFNDALLLAMFGPDAVQHATPGSYPAYFQSVFERGLLRADGPTNPFLQHVLLGRYLGRDAPPFLRSGMAPRWDTVLGGLLDVPDLSRFDLVHVSNIFDWSDDAAVVAWCEALHALRPGAGVTLRQLNNHRDLRTFLPGFAFDDALGQRLQRADRSLFYNRVEIAVRT